ncbi:hypothetical protein SAMD00019534_066970 [Acytostelium subglobosum LB1]|uniref:hypothetical protein n=1 Tax=Acytostelium subglobosum LB1 TaxID=1410327 RepID=UPI000644A6C6|nr:hypothetical protein SAMD00019534_066970 [Acytostelium subglobosum LB1]GAM23522.1 hypothetical protein SAMD00019534_066970 [Acytostelium subglobosum LB1]|eukprot:XP_012753263.1 hypothetical protein SAMD00019534_066970 [Acytostelium subglobosum LB1]
MSSPIINPPTIVDVGFKDHFGVVGDKYRTFRPPYPEELYEIIKKSIEHTDKDLALDIGCGSGQWTVQLASMVKRVIGFDPSPGQLANAMPAPNVEYRSSPAEKIDHQQDHSVDLITVATAIHWFDLPKFFEECRRLLKPNGVLAFFTYNINQFANPDAQAINIDLYDNILAPYWAPNRYLIDRKYIDIVPPFENTVRGELLLERKVSIAQLLGVYSTWSGYNKYLQSNSDILPEIKQRLLTAFNTSDVNHIVDITIPHYYVICRM